MAGKIFDWTGVFGELSKSAYIAQANFRKRKYDKSREKLKCIDVYENRTCNLYISEISMNFVHDFVWRVNW